MEAKKKPIDKLTFEEALSQLEDIASKLEDGELGLDDSITRFEYGTELVKLCQNKLEEAQRKVEILQKGSDGDDKGRKDPVKRRRVKVKEDTGEIDDKEDVQGSLL